MESNHQPEERHEGLPKDDASIEILSENGESEWSRCSTNSSSIAGSDVSSMDFQKLSIRFKNAKIVHQDGRQFIERRDSDDGGLPYSAEFYLNDELWKLNGEDCLLLSHRRYIAKVSVEGTVDLDRSIHFKEAVRALLKHLKVVKVLLDEQLEECNKATSDLEMILGKLAGESGQNIDHTRDVMLLRILLQKHGNSLNMTFKHGLRNCSRLSSDTMSALDNYVTTTLKLIQRNEILGHMNDSLLSDEFINAALQKALTIHQDRLGVICPTTLMDKLKELPDDHILCVSTDDMNLFNDLTTLEQTMFESVLPMIFSKFLTKVQESNEEQFVNLDPLSNRIFLYILKSLQEVAEQLGANSKNDNAIIFTEALGWEVTILQEESLSPYSKCLRQQLQMLARLANHFEPGGPFRTSRFPYEFKLFHNMDAIPEPVRIWMCLLDDCMKDLVQADIDKMQMLSCFFKSYVSFISSEEFHGEILECLRTITHDALKSLTELKSSSQQDQTTSDSDLLEYNDMISCCLDKFLCEHFENDCRQIQATLRRIIGQALNNVESEESTEFCYEFKQLLKEINDLPMEWYIQLPPSENRSLFLRGQFVLPVDNRWKDTEHECLKVVDLEGFVKLYKLLLSNKEIPNHYQLKVIQALLDKLAAKQSFNEGKLRSKNQQLGAMTNIINSIRNAMLYLNTQPDYSCFEHFQQKLGETFSYMIEKRRLENYHNPMSSMNDSAASDPSHRETLDPLLDLFEGSISKQILTNGLNIYVTQFCKHIAETVQFPREKRIEQIVSDVVLKVKPQLATTWTEEFKRNELPEVLAGLSAVWSLIVSKNGSSSEQLVKPSNLQISCILSFFGDQNLNIDDLYKLLYISTQQGKQLVIGLTAALLALHGHKVLIACFNSNLARRNSTHLIEVFNSFSIDSNISFGSVEDMAREQSREVYEKCSAYMYEKLGIDFKAISDNQPSFASQCKSSIFLIEDIDILLLDQTLGQKTTRFVRPTIPGLALVQEKFFCDRNNCRNYAIDKFIKQSSDPEICQLRAFLDKPQSYIINDGPKLQEKEYTNRTLFNKHVEIFQDDMYPYYGSIKSRLSRNGVVMFKTYNDCHDKRDYAYLLLKKSDLQQTVNGYTNYGFLTLGFIPFPYALLLRSYPLVFGFESAPLDSYEEITMHNHYDIYHKIAESNPLQTIPVKFDSKKDFLCVDSSNQLNWMSAIMVAINAAIERKCSVLVFFKSDLEMEAFQSKFALSLKRLCVTAIETASNGENLAEGDFAADEVTVLVIERIGDLAEDLEVHVIQTFFSADGKEEDLIRRQAERSHGSGSYELIVSKIHVSIPDENREDEATYDLLVKLRKPRSFGDAMDCLTENMEKYEKIKTSYKIY